MMSKFWYDWLLFIFIGKDATEDFEDAGHSKSARELLEKFCIGELDTPTPLIPQLEIVKKQQKNLSKKFMELTKQYSSTVSVAAVGLAVIVTVFYVRSRKWKLFSWIVHNWIIETTGI